MIPLHEISKEGYVCVAQKSFCLVYLPQDVNENLSVEAANDARAYPDIAGNEIIIAPILCITSENADLLLKKPAIIELVKSVELSDKEASNTIVPLYAKSDFSQWKELGSNCHCKVFKDRISFQVTHFCLYTVISRKPYPSSTMTVKPASPDVSTLDHSFTSTELTIPELPGLKVEIPPFSLNADRDTDITVTALYDSPAVCSVQDRHCLAASCIRLEPHDITFSKAVTISIPIPNYAEDKKNHPNAKLQIWHTNIRPSDNVHWNLLEHYISRDDEGRYIAVFLTEHFCWLKTLLSIYKWVKSQLYTTKFSIKARCQVFMSQEIQLQPSQDIQFSITVQFYPYKKEPEPIPRGYIYTLLDSELLHFEISNDDTLCFEVELDDCLLPKKRKPITGSFVLASQQIQHQSGNIIELNHEVNFQSDQQIHIGVLSLGIKGKPKDTYQTLVLIKVFEFL